MNADAFRSLYEYHFSENRKLWEKYVVPLSWEQFTRPAEYSHGSVRAQLVHLMDVDVVWFAELQGSEPSTPLPEPHEDDRPGCAPTGMRSSAPCGGTWPGCAMRCCLPAPSVSRRKTEGWQYGRSCGTWSITAPITEPNCCASSTIWGQATEGQDFIFYVYEHPEK